MPLDAMPLSCLQLYAEAEKRLRMSKRKDYYKVSRSLQLITLDLE